MFATANTTPLKFNVLNPERLVFQKVFKAVVRKKPVIIVFTIVANTAPFKSNVLNPERSAFANVQQAV
jgi:hypothetical protein